MINRLRAAVAPFVFVVSGCGSVIRPDQQPLAVLRPRAESEPSWIFLSVPLKLAPAGPEIDKLIPDLSDPGWTKTHKVADGICATWFFDRKPAILSTSGGRVAVSLPGGFGLIADPHSGLLGCTQFFVSCGDKSAKVKPVPVALHLSAPLTLAENYRLSGQLRNDGTEFIEPCKILFGLISVTDEVKKVIDDRVNDKLPALNGVIAAKVDLKPTAQKAWDQLQQPIPVADGYSLVVRPEVIMGKLTGQNNDAIRASIGIRGSLAVVSSSKAPSVKAVPLPPLGQLPQDAGGVHIALDGTLPYKELTDQLQVALGGKTKTYDYLGRTWTFRIDQVLETRGPVECTDVRGCLVITLKFSGDAEGILYVMGSPEVDNLQQEIILHDVRFSKSTSDVLLQAADWLLHGQIEAAIATAAHLSFQKQKRSAVETLTAAVNRDLGNDLRMKGSLERNPKVMISLGRDGIDYRVIADGQVTIDQVER